jgi:hypothetical protein
LSQSFKQNDQVRVNPNLDEKFLKNFRHCVGTVVCIEKYRHPHIYRVDFSKYDTWQFRPEELVKAV